MKTLLIILVLVANLGFASEVSPVLGLREKLESFQDNTGTRKNLKEMKLLSNERNTEIQDAVENYLIAKNNVMVARAQFNPFTTGHLLGIAAGLNYYWAPLLVESILSIPMKIHNVNRNKFISQASFYNLQEVKKEINNELAHLYFDILTHEIILKTIDQEVEILTYQLSKWEEREFSQERLNDLKKWIIRLNMERSDILSLYTSELSALKTLVTLTGDKFYSLSHIRDQLDSEVVADLDLKKLQEHAINASNRYNAAVSLERASRSNVKAVKWSIITWSGLRLSYKANVVEAKNEAIVARSRKQSVAAEVKNQVLIDVEKLNLGLELADNYNKIFEESLDIYEDTANSVDLGVLSEDNLIETALSAIRDYRSMIVSHYGAWSAYDDLGKSSNFDFISNSKKLKDGINKTLELSPFYEIQSNNINVKVKIGASRVELSLDSKALSSVESVEYTFAHNQLPKMRTENDVNSFLATISVSDGEYPLLVSGVAKVKLNSGKVLNVKF